MSSTSCERRHAVLTVGAETLAADIISAAAPDPVHTLVLHGAGQSHRQRQWALRESLAGHRCASAAIDFSGHGDSSAALPNSLAKRLAEAQAALDRLTLAPRTVVGISMSGEIAMRLACRPENRIEHLVTIVGAIYDGAAFDVPFGPVFSTVLRRRESWRDAAVLKMIGGFRGDITLIRAQHDQVIPGEIAELIRANAVAARSCNIIDIGGAGHNISERSASDLDMRTQLANAIIARPAMHSA